ncbi:Histidinol-phosphatase [Rubripirellula lacrimiformis]|uniref:Histidinol-phosphatase n=1 Tax=Rubripirellula lacrimiformis TaxID=1930273 RepID=A0A517NC52_9BACT|nr:histidinol-phosphatase HisJ family protein [Rubripirellula lacrimiformis]QDT04713.1 Histidinol-phosphatase [Rubripirellula lacrimiformis]
MTSPDIAPANGILFESHSHTPLCNHADGWPTEYAVVAQQRGLRGLIVTCHNPMPNGFSARVRMREEEFGEYIDLVEQTRQQWEGRVDVRLGIEADYFEGHESYLQKQLDSADFHFVLGSVHPQIDEFRERYWSDDAIEVQRTYFRLLAKAAQTGLFDSLAHPDLIKNLFSETWDPAAVMDDIRSSLDAIADTGVAMELNTSGINKRISEMNPFPDMLCEMNARGIPVTLGADAHQPDRVADGYEAAMQLLLSCGYEHVHFFLNRKRQTVAISDALASLVDTSTVG